LILFFQFAKLHSIILSDWTDRKNFWTDRKNFFSACQNHYRWWEIKYEY